MDPTAADQQPKEQRILAAIVFTDVVGFSKLAAANEARVYTSLQRDMAVITSLCRAHSGQVLNTMGDGMLLCFTSAVDAMSCAMEIQRTLFSQAQTLPASDVLHHRIGVHLGDIIMSGDNVFGDGVNIAARLQAEAKPDGICFSKTVHEVIKNKLKVEAQYMAPRQLKNIGRVEIWQIPPIEEARQKAMEALVAAPLDPKPDPAGARGYKAIALTVAMLFCLGAIVFLVKMAANRGIPASAKPGSALKDKSALVRNWTANMRNGGKPSESADSKDDPKITEPTTPPSGAVPVAELTAKLDEMKKAFAFDQAAAFLDGDGKTIPDSAAQAQTFRDLAEMKRWMDSEVNVATASNKIGTTLTISGTPTDVAVYRDPSGAGYTVEMPTGEQQVVPFHQFGAAGIVSLGTALISRPITHPEGRAQTWLTEFQQQYPQ
jgi:class 3 adenylate cyclase